MKKTILTVALISSCLANPSFASFSLHKNSASKPTAKVSTKGNYTDFSGTWSGTCTGDDESNVATFTIKNDDVSFEIDGQDYSIGTIKTESTSDKSHSDFSHGIINWNTDRTELLFEETDTAYEHSDYPYNKSKSLLTTLVKGNIALEKEQLVLKVEAIAFYSLSQSNEKVNRSCTLDKVK